MRGQGLRKAKGRAMSAGEARDYLETLVATHTGRSIIRDLNFGGGAEAIIEAPRRGDDKSSIEVATACLKEFRRRYPTLV